MKKYLIKFLKVTGLIIIFFVLYVFLITITSYIPVNQDFRTCQSDAIEIYIMTNGVHTDLVVPLKNEMKDWSTLVNPMDTKSKDREYQFVAFGWGDKGFYLNTPSWSDLQFKTAFKALFYLSSSVMHVEFYKNIKTNESSKKISICPENYQLLINYIEEAFVLKEEKTQCIAGASYGIHDLFYEAKGTYSLFYTCNTWANNGLKRAKLKACLWTLFDSPIFNKYN